MEDFGKEIMNGFEKEMKKQKMIQYTKYVGVAVLVGVAGYAAYKGLGYLKDIDESLKKIERGVATTAPVSDDVVSL